MTIRTNLHERKHCSYSVIENSSTPSTPSEVELVPISSPPLKQDRRYTDHDTVNLSFEKSPPKKSRLFSRLGGWRLGALMSAMTALLSLIVNTGVVIWLLGKGLGEVIIPLYRGSCSTVTKIDIVVHLAINILSTILLGGSNYCMQCLVAPTRAEIDKAHAKGAYLDVAVQSLRNLGSLSMYKVFLWSVLAISSLPLHLIAAVSASTIQANLTIYDILNPEECIRAYANGFLSSRRNLVLMVDGKLNQDALPQNVLISSSFNKSASDSLVWQTAESYSSSSPFQWICDSDPYLESKLRVRKDEIGNNIPCWMYWQQWLQKVDEWNPYGQKIASCYSEIVPEQCTYSANLPIIAVVMACNLLKALAMLCVAFYLGGNPIITVGDALSSFLQKPDPTTKGFCLLSRGRVQSHTWPLVEGEESGPLPVVPTQRWLWSSSAKRRYLLFYTFVVALVVSCVFLGLAISALAVTGYTVGSLAFGKLQPANIVRSSLVLGNGSATAQIMFAVLTANAPQAIMSFLYLNPNAFLTVMWLASEFADFATERKSLRVSSRQGKQRSTYFLSLPYRIALPLMAFSALLHWLLSQSIFLAVVAEYDAHGKLLSQVAVASCAFSPLAMILSLLAVLILLGATACVAWVKKLRGGIPVAGSCSAAISAACHPPAWDKDAYLKEVMWGVPKEREGQRRRKGGVQHACFTSGEVDEVKEEMLYA